MVDKIFIDWQKFEYLVEELAIKVNLELKSIKYIHGLSRGGLIPAVMLSHKLQIPYLDDPSLEKREDILIVDDIADSGKTLKEWSNFQTAVLHYKPHSSLVAPTLYAEKHTTDDWIIYPWEREDSQTIQDYKLDNSNKFHIFNQ